MPHTATIPSAIADLGLSIDVPDGFIQADVPPTETDFDNPTQSAPIAIFSSQVALAIIAIAARPAYETGSVLQWIHYLTDHFEISLTSVETGAVGKDNAHPAIIAQATQVQNGDQLRLVIVAFEDGGRLVTAHAMCPAELWQSYGEALSAAVRTITLRAPKGPTHDLDSTTAEGWTKVSAAMQRRNTERYLQELEARRKPAELAAAALIEQGKFEEAEAAVQQADSSIYGAVALARLYETRLKALAGHGAPGKQRDRTERVFRRALSWAQNCYPEAHTQEEADSHESGRAQDRTRLVKLLGYDPDQ